VRFRYSSNEVDYIEWTTRSIGKPVHPDILDFLRHVPRFELEDSITVDVVE
jgi:hypothetical protein